MGTSPHLPLPIGESPPASLTSARANRFQRNQLPDCRGKAPALQDVGLEQGNDPCMDQGVTMSRRNNEPTADDSLLIRLASRFFFAVTIILLFLSMVQCTIKKPASPSWDTQVVVPLLNRTYAMPEIIEKIDSDYLSIDSLDQVLFRYHAEIDTFGLEADNLTTGDLSYAVSQTLGAIAIEAPVVAPVVVSLAEIGPLAAVVPGAVPPMTFQVSNNLAALSTFSSATFSQGSLMLTVTNDLGIDLSSVTVLLADRSDNHVLGNQSVPGGLVAGESKTVTLDLAGQTISNQLRVDIDCATAGGSVLSASDKQLSSAVGFSSTLEVTSAVAAIDSQVRTFSQNVQLIEDDRVVSATIEGGFLFVAIENNTALASNVDVAFPDLLQAGQPMHVTQLVAPGDTGVVNVPLAGVLLSPGDQVLPQTLNIDVTATVIGSAPAHVTVDQQDQFAVSASITGLSFASVTGEFSSTAITLDQTTEAIDVPNGFDAISLQSAQLDIEIANGVGLAGSVQLQLLADNGKSMTIQGNVAAGPAGSGRVQSVLTDTTIADFLSPLPSQITISGSANLGGGGQVATIEAGDDITATVRITAPFEVIIDQTSLDPEIEAEDLNAEDLDGVVDDLTEARLIYSIGNHLPIGTSVTLLLAADSLSLYSDPIISIPNITLPAAPTAGGVASDTAFTGEQTIVLSGDEFEILRADSVYIGTFITLAGTSGQTVKLTGSDFIMTTARIEVDYRFDGSF